MSYIVLWKRGLKLPRASFSVFVPLNNYLRHRHHHIPQTTTGRHQVFHVSTNYYLLSYDKYFILDIVQQRVKPIRSVLVALISIYLGDIRISSPSLLTYSTLVL